MSQVIAAACILATAVVAAGGLIALALRKGSTVMSLATDRLTASAAAVAAAFDTLLTRIPVPSPPVDETPILAAADALDALKVKIDATDPAVVTPPAA